LHPALPAALVIAPHKPIEIRPPVDGQRGTD
jgi:hypothetical protein